MRWSWGGDPFVQEVRRQGAGHAGPGVEHVTSGRRWWSRRGGAWEHETPGAPGGTAAQTAALEGEAARGAALGGAVPSVSWRRALRLVALGVLVVAGLSVLFYWGFQTVERSQGSTSGASQGSAADAVQGSAGEAVSEPGEAVIESDASVTDEYEYRGLELERHEYPDYHFRVDVPGTPYEVKAGDRTGWDFGVRLVVDGPGVRDDAVFEVLATVQSDTLLHGETAVARYLADVEAQYTGGYELRSATSGRINGHPCAIARARYAGSQSPDPVVTTEFWVPGDGYEYLVRCIAFEEDWARARRPMMAIASTFDCW